MKVSKKLVLSALTAMTAFVLVACGNSGQNPSKQLNLKRVPLLLSHLRQCHQIARQVAIQTIAQILVVQRLLLPVKQLLVT